MREEKQEDNFQRLNLLSLGQPSTHSRKYFSISIYSKKNHTKGKADADLIRRGDFRELVRRNYAREI